MVYIGIKIYRNKFKYQDIDPMVYANNVDSFLRSSIICAYFLVTTF